MTPLSRVSARRMPARSAASPVRPTAAALPSWLPQLQMHADMPAARLDLNVDPSLAHRRMFIATDLIVQIYDYNILKHHRSLLCTAQLLLPQDRLLIWGVVLSKWNQASSCVKALSSASSLLVYALQL